MALIAIIALYAIRNYYILLVFRQFQCFQSPISYITPCYFHGHHRLSVYGKWVEINSTKRRNQCRLSP